MEPKMAGRVDGSYRPAGQRLQAISPFAGLITGTKIRTPDTEMAVQDLKAGDDVMTRNGGAVSVSQLETVDLVTQAIQISAGSLGALQPDHDVLLPADQMVLIRDWRANSLLGQPQAMIAALALVDDEFIQDHGEQLLTLHRIYCGAPRVLYANGLEVASADDAVSNRGQHAA
ncbi:Hint domain-containing protein [uncultured Roseobacter sp.]|uniref:Hint domain-containing protein n=1 Tax=uncultured Roseobacter sp. TaxID=114847 RepID=UPI00261F33D3|nr:Hint domain-containing protein [uncultured Roseobacter sp.]